MRTLRISLLIVLGLDLVLIGLPVLFYPALLSLPGSISIVIEPAVLLAAYGLIVVLATRSAEPNVVTTLRIATTCGLVAGFISMAHIAQENYAHLEARTTALLTWTFILGMFLPWAVAGYAATRRTAQSAAGVMAGSWSALVCMILTVTVGWSQLLWSLPRLEHRNLRSPDFLRSGWTDLRAFTIADLFQAGFGHLLLGPIIGALLGSLAGLLGKRVTSDR